MIVGNGVDTIEIERVAAIIKKSDRFITRNFTKKEQAMFKAKINRIESIAANFAAKEAVSKTFGTGIRGFNFTDIEVLRTDQGKPYVVLYGNAQKIAKNLNIEKIHLSLSHDKSKAMAFAIAETTCLAEQSLK